MRNVLILSLFLNVGCNDNREVKLDHFKESAKNFSPILAGLTIKTAFDYLWIKKKSDTVTNELKEIREEQKNLNNFQQLNIKLQQETKSKIATLNEIETNVIKKLKASQKVDAQTQVDSLMQTAETQENKKLETLNKLLSQRSQTIVDKERVDRRLSRSELISYSLEIGFLSKTSVMSSNHSRSIVESINKLEKLYSHEMIGEWGERGKTHWQDLEETIKHSNHTMFQNRRGEQQRQAALRAINRYFHSDTEKETTEYWTHPHDGPYWVRELYALIWIAARDAELLSGQEQDEAFQQIVLNLAKSQRGFQNGCYEITLAADDDKPSEHPEVIARFLEPIYKLHPAVSIMHTVESYDFFVNSDNISYRKMSDKEISNYELDTDYFKRYGGLPARRL